MSAKTSYFPCSAGRSLDTASQSIQGQLQTKARKLKKSTLLDLSYFFKQWLPPTLLLPTCSGVHSRERIYTFPTTFWAFLYQVLVPGVSCREVVKKVQACAVMRKQKGPGSNTSAYCQSRRRLSIERLQSICKEVSKAVQRSCREVSQWHGRCVKVIDATGISMPDTPDLQQAWPQQGCQKPGCGFPMLKLVGLFDLASGILVHWVSSNKHHHESSLFQQLWNHLKKGDILLADRAYCAYGTLSAMTQRGVDSVFRLHQRRRGDFRRGKRLGPCDRVVEWTRPLAPTQGWSPDQWQTLQRTLTLRIIRYLVQQPGFRTKKIELVTTLLDHQAFPASELAKLYLQRWSVELFYRDIKITMGMDVLRTQSVEMIQRELIMHVIAYNLIRALISEAASHYQIALQRISFKGVLDQFRQWEPFLQIGLIPLSKWHHIKLIFFRFIAETLIPQRPGRVEPRARKRRPKNYLLMNKPRKKMLTPPHREKTHK